jgi:hypothetical protein
VGGYPQMTNDFSPMAPADREQNEAWARLETLPRGAFHVRLGGCLPPGWAGTFALGLSRLHITILRGYAWQSSRGRWAADFEIQRREGAPKLDLVDYVVLATRHDRDAATVPIRLERYSLVPMTGGALRLAIRGRDCVGFLGSLLDRFAVLGLLPEEMHIETYGATAEDRFQLRSTAGAAVGEGTRTALDADLAASLSSRAPRRFVM